MRRVRQGERGAASVEYVGVLLVVAAVLAAVVIPGSWQPGISRGICTVMSRLFGGGACSGGGPTSAEPRKPQDLGLYCIKKSDESEFGINGVFRNVRADSTSKDKVEYDANGSATVSLTSEGAIGLETPTKELGKNKSLELKANAKIQGDLIYKYAVSKEQGGAQAADDLRNNRSGYGQRYLKALAPGANTVAEGVTRIGNGAQNLLNSGLDKIGLGPSEEEKKRIALAQQVNEADAVQAQLTLTATGNADLGLKSANVKGELSGSISGTVTAALSDQGTTSFAGEYKWDAKAEAEFGTWATGSGKNKTELAKFLNVGIGGGHTGGYVVTFDKDGNPKTLTLINETRIKAGGGVNLPDGFEQTLSGKGFVGNVYQEKKVIDLRDPEGKKLFDQAFASQPYEVPGLKGQVVVPRFLGGDTGWLDAMSQLNDYADTQGYTANYAYATYGDDFGGADETNVKAGGFGGGFAKKDQTMLLINATGRDNRAGESDHELASCTTN